MFSAALLLTSVSAPAVRAQVEEGAVEAYQRAVADHFRLPADEIAVLTAWSIAPAEVAVVLLLAREAGVSADALVAMKRGGRGWSEVAARYGVGAEELHVPMQSPPGGVLARAYGEFASRPRSEWGQIRLEDREIVYLVNLKVLSDALDMDPARVLQAAEGAGSWPEAYRVLVRGR